jgi:hypothetical protein
MPLTVGHAPVRDAAVPHLDERAVLVSGVAVRAESGRWLLTARTSVGEEPAIAPRLVSFAPRSWDDVCPDSSAQN